MILIIPAFFWVLCVGGLIPVVRETIKERKQRG